MLDIICINYEGMDQEELHLSRCCAKIDILAQAMELSSIPSDSNNNLDIVGQAMEMSDIQSDMMMNF